MQTSGLVGKETGVAELQCNTEHNFTSRWCGCASISAYSGITASVDAVNTVSGDSGRPAACTGAPVNTQELRDSLMSALVANMATAHEVTSHVYFCPAGAATCLYWKRSLSNHAKVQLAARESVQSWCSSTSNPSQVLCFFSRPYHICSVSGACSQKGFAGEKPGDKKGPNPVSCCLWRRA